MFEKFLKRSTWIDIVISTIFALFGFVLIIKPNEAMGALSTVLGIVFIAMGVLKLVEYFSEQPKEDYLLTIALVSVVFGVIVLFCSDLILSFFRVVLGIWIIATGIKDLQTTLVWKNVKSGYWTTALILSSLVIVSGIVVLINQNIILTVLGVIITAYALLDIISKVIFIKKIEKN